jgi:hypothetical protein
MRLDTYFSGVALEVNGMNVATELELIKLKLAQAEILNGESPQSLQQWLNQRETARQNGAALQLACSAVNS